MGNKLFYLIIILIIGGFIAAFLMIQNYNSNPDNLSESGYYPYTDIEASDLKGPSRDLLDNENYHYNVTLSEAVDKVNEADEILVYFWSPICPYCLEATPLMVEALDSTDVELIQLNIYEYGAASNVFMIASTPTLAYYENGLEIERLEGNPGSTEGYVEFIEAVTSGDTVDEELETEESTDVEDAEDSEDSEDTDNTDEEDE